MKTLKLPVGKSSLPVPDRLSMDEYWHFVKFGLKHRFRPDAYESGQHKDVVVTPFKLTNPQKAKD